MRFKVGDRVTRDERDLQINWSARKTLHGEVIRAYSDYGMFGFYPELYDVKWDDGSKINKAYLPHGLEPETVCA
jgi:hypothetical protein